MTSLIPWPFFFVVKSNKRGQSPKYKVQTQVKKTKPRARETLDNNIYKLHKVPTLKETKRNIKLGQLQHSSAVTEEFADEGLKLIEQEQRLLQTTFKTSFREKEGGQEVLLQIRLFLSFHVKQTAEAREEIYPRIPTGKNRPDTNDQLCNSLNFHATFYYRIQL